MTNHGQEITRLYHWRVTPWMPKVPIPGRTHDRRQVRMTGAPRQYVLSFGGIGNESGRITRAWGFDVHADGPPGHLADTLDHLQNRITAPTRQIQELGRIALPKIVQCAYMRFGKIAHVDVVANRSSVGCRMGVPEYRDLANLPGCRLKDIGNQMSFRIVM